MIIPLSLASMGPFITAYSQSDLIGKIIILGLISLSILCWVILIQKIWITRQVAQISQAFRKAFLINRERVLHMEMVELPKPANRLIPHPFGEIFRDLKSKTVEILNKNLYFSTQATGKEQSQVYLSQSDLEMIESHVMTTISAQIRRLEKNLFILSTIITLAPFLGLLGTVWGILVTFAELGSGGSASSNMAVLGGLSTALSTTVLGLVIAIPALISYNYLKNALKNFSSDMEEFLYQLLSSVEIQYRRADVSG